MNQFSHFLIFLFLTTLSTYALSKATTASKKVDAKIEGNASLETIGNEAVISLNGNKCSVKSEGENGSEGQPKSFRIVLKCGSKTQTLWDKNTQPKDEYVFFDDPKFEILWAGDIDGDSKIDLEMYLNPKYTCLTKVLFVSTKAMTSEIVNVKSTEKECD